MSAALIVQTCGFKTTYIFHYQLEYCYFRAEISGVIIYYIALRLSIQRLQWICVNF